MILSLESPRAKAIGRVAILDDAVTARYPEKDDVWRVTCKKLLYQWEFTRWQRSFAAGVNLQHRAAELTHRLLRAGFIVEVEEAVAELVTTATYEPESFRNVRAYTAGEYAGWFCITWARSEDLYGLATRLPSAHWDGRAVVVSHEYFEEVIDFAATHGFVLSDGAKKLAEQEQQERDSIIILPVPPLPKLPPATDKRPSLPAPEFVEIDRELMDDEYNDSAV
jgi:hypothetical protein